MSVAIFRFALLATCLTLTSAVHAQSETAPKPPITFELLDSDNAPRFFDRLPRRFNWLPDGGHYLQRQRGRLMQVNADTDEAAPAYDWNAVIPALREHADIPDNTASRLALRPVDHTDNYRQILMVHQQRPLIYDFEQNKLIQLPELPGRRLTSLSPAAGYISFVTDYNLHVLDVANREIRPLTTDGNEIRRHAILDWVYQEELYGRGNWSAHWWRDDDQYIAYLTLDSAAVPLYTVVDFLPLYSTTEQTRYPKPGQPNPTVALTIANPESGDRVPVDLSRYADEDILITRVSWAPDGMLIFSVQDREQRWLELVEADPATGATNWLIRETSPAWTDRLPHPHWLPDNSFLWLSDREGRRNIFHYLRDGRLIRQITTSPIAVSDILCANQEHDIIAFTGSRETPLERHAYRTTFAGTEVQQITTPGFHHTVSANPHGTRFITTASNLTTPGSTQLLDGAGGILRTLATAEIPALDDYAWNTPELHIIPNRQRQPVHVLLTKPANFHPNNKYPVWIDIYGGPGAQTIYNTWPRRFAGDQALANEGILVLRIDPRSATGGGFAAAQWSCYKNLGVAELDDVHAVLDWLNEQGYADLDRVGITGVSYGGYLAAFALTSSNRFKLGLSVMPVTDWRLYDSIYTERFMRTPENNPEGYAAGSAVENAENLSGRLILVHGVRDDNVHVQNTIQLIDALQRAEKNFELMLYPRDRHGFFHGARHWRQLERRTILEGL